LGIVAAQQKAGSDHPRTQQRRRYVLSVSIIQGLCQCAVRSQGTEMMSALVRPGGPPGIGA
jgi:hypothetical protein